MECSGTVIRTFNLEFRSWAAMLKLV